MQQIIGAGDDVDGGITYKFNRFALGADTTLDNGWTAESFAIEVGNLAAGGLSGYLPTSNSMYVAMDAMTITVGAAAICNKCSSTYW